jgi:hypothetical protein
MMAQLANRQAEEGQKMDDSETEERERSKDRKKE